MKTFRNIGFGVLSLLLFACSSGGGDAIKIGSGDGRLALAIKNTVVFDPNISHSRIDYFVVSIAGDGIEKPIKQKFGYDTQSVTFEGFDLGKDIDVVVEAVNYNGYVILRGSVNDVLVDSEDTTVSEIDVKGVPVFANVYHNATVYKNRFIPRIYAPENLEFEIVSSHNGTESVLVDSISGNIDFSISAADTNQVKAVYIEPLNEGTQQLTVRDINTDEYTTITLNIIDSGPIKTLPTTAGAYAGSLMSEDPFYQQSSLEHYFKALTQ